MEKLFGVILLLTFALTGSVWAEDDLSARITAIEDRLAIEKLVEGDYSRALDEVRMKDYADLWAPDGILIIPSLKTVHGPDNIYKLLSTPGIFDPKPKEGEPKRPSSSLPKPYQVPHHISSLRYEVNRDTASGSSYWLEVALKDGIPQVVGSGHYLDELVKINGQWKFSKRTIVRDIPAMTPEEMAHVPEYVPDE